MDKNTIKKYAVWARRELIERVMQRAMLYGITSESYGDPDAESVNGNLLSPGERQQRRALVANIQAKGFEQVMEEAAYTWFNRFAALRFMEVNGYLPSYIRVFTNDAGEFKPQILSEAIHLELPGLDMERVYELESANESGKLFKYLLIVQCNALNRILPVMFQKIDDYTELLLPDNLLREGSVIERMVAEIPEEDWKDSVQILGWLYQYYNSERKDEVFAALRKNVKITKENIPAATQLFTPDWIVRYMVENSLGRLWLEGHPNDELKAGWKYWLDEAQQEPDAEAKLAEIRKGYAVLSPTEIRCIDPCAGSGHILVYMFDVLMQIYESAGYTAREAVRGIIENNLFGLDIDERAAQLAYFSVMMKARQYDRRFLTRTGDDGLPDIPQPRVLAVHESNRVDEYVLDYFVHGDAALRTALDSILHELHDAKEYGSILRITPVDFPALYARFDEIRTDAHMARDAAIDQLLPIVQTAELLASQYHIVVTNPPYMGTSGVNPKALEYVKKHYPDSKSDFSTVMMERTLEMCTEDGFMSMINIPVWMFLSSYEKMRQRIVAENTFVNMVHPGRGIFGSDFGTTTFVLGKKLIKGYIGSYRRLFDKQGEVQSIEERKEAFLAGKGPFTAQQDNFAKIPGCPVAYWVSDNFIKAFKKGKILRNLTKIPKGLSTGSVDKFMRFWYEVLLNKIDYSSHSCEESKERGYKWFPYAKGGAFRRWNGNLEYVVNWQNDGFEVKNFVDERGKQRSRPQNTAYYFKQCMTYSAITSYKYSLRYLDRCIFGGGGDSIHSNDEKLFNVIFALMNTNLAQYYLSVISPTMNFEVDHIKRVPLIIDNDSIPDINELVEENVVLSQMDWDSFETSWDFQVHPLVPNHPGTACHPSTGGELRVADCYSRWERECEERFARLKANEEELNRIFIDIYGLQDELTPEVEEKDVTVRRADLSRDIRSLVSYAVGCMFGRYSLDTPGLAYAGGDWDPGRYVTFPADKDGILPICDDEYFHDDIVNLFAEFVKTVYGESTLEENLRFIADALGSKGSSPREMIRNYFLNSFYADHLKIYQKRPIYWLFDSGKKNGFKCLVYLHRYRPDTIARVRTDYVHEQQSRYRTAIADLEQRVNNASTSERLKLSKQLAVLQAQADELQTYEEKIHHLADQMIPLDLDDGVKVNYAKLGEVVRGI